MVKGRGRRERDSGGEGKRDIYQKETSDGEGKREKRERQWW